MSDNSETGLTPKKVENSDINSDIPPSEPFVKKSLRKTKQKTSISLIDNSATKKLTHSSAKRIFVIKNNKQSDNKLQNKITIPKLLPQINSLKSQTCSSLVDHDKPIIITSNSLNGTVNTKLIVGINQKGNNSIKALLNSTKIEPSLNSSSSSSSESSVNASTSNKIAINKTLQRFTSEELTTSPVTNCEKMSPNKKHEIKVLTTSLLECDSSSVPLEKRLVRKFQLDISKKHGSTSSVENTFTSNNRRKVEKNYNVDEIPKLGRPIKVPMPKILLQEYNKLRNRHERLVLLPTKEIRLTEAETQTEENEFKNSCFNKKPILLKIEGDSHNRFTNLKRNSCDDSLSHQPPKKRPSILRSTEKKNMIDNSNVTASNSNNININTSNDIISTKNDMRKITKPMTELEAIQIKYKLSNTDVMRAKQEYINCIIPDDAGNYPLHNAIIKRNEPNIMRAAVVLKACINHINIRNHSGLAPIHLALIHGSSKMVLMKLIYCGANLNLRDLDGNTVLHLAIRHCSPSPSILNFLLPLTKSLVNVVNDEGNAPLHVAALENKEKHLSFLAGVPGIDINLTDAKSGRTALFLALENRHFNFARLLVKHGCDREICNFAGQTVATLGAESTQFKNVLNLLTKKRIRKKEWEKCTNDNYSSGDEGDLQIAFEDSEDDDDYSSYTEDDDNEDTNINNYKYHGKKYERDVEVDN